jgi:urease accessory protein
MRMAMASPVTITTTAAIMITAMAEPGPLRALDGAPDTPPAAAEALSTAALQRLLAWLSPAFPVGGFSYSHGLEWAIEDGSVITPAGMKDWIGDVLHHGAGRSDAILFAHAWRATAGHDHGDLRDIAELAAALQPSRERHLEATAQGQAFLSTVAATWPNDAFDEAAAALDPEVPPTYAVAVAMAAACHGVPLREAVIAFLGAFAANLISAGVRAIPIGQTDGQRTLAALSPLVTLVADAAMDAPLGEIGGVALRADIASMKHETQYTRLFRS